LICDLDTSDGNSNCSLKDAGLVCQALRTRSQFASKTLLDFVVSLVNKLFYAGLPEATDRHSNHCCSYRCPYNQFARATRTRLDSVHIHRKGLHLSLSRSVSGPSGWRLPGLRGLYHLPLLFRWSSLGQQIVCEDTLRRTAWTPRLETGHIDSRNLRLQQRHLQRMRESFHFVVSCCAIRQPNW